MVPIIVFFEVGFIISMKRDSSSLALYKFRSGLGLNVIPFLTYKRTPFFSLSRCANWMLIAGKVNGRFRLQIFLYF